MIEAAATLRSLKSGRVLTVDTDQPGLQVYTGNWLSGSPLNHAGRSYADYDGVALEAQGWPDAPNRPDFPSQAITPETPPGPPNAARSVSDSPQWHDCLSQ